jgi:hypothetical protein
MANPELCEGRYMVGMEEAGVTAGRWQNRLLSPTLKRLVYNRGRVSFRHSNNRKFKENSSMNKMLMALAFASMFNAPAIVLADDKHKEHAERQREAAHDRAEQQREWSQDRREQQKEREKDRAERQREEAKDRAERQREQAKDRAEQQRERDKDLAERQREESKERAEQRREWEQDRREDQKEREKDRRQMRKEWEKRTEIKRP